MKTRLHLLTIIIICSFQAMELLSEESSLRGPSGTCIKVFKRFVTLPEGFLIHPASPSLDPNLLLSASCLGPPDCTFASGSRSEIRGPGSLSFLIGKKPELKIDYISRNKSYRLVSEDGYDDHFKKITFQRLGKSGVDLLYDSYLSIIYDDDHYVAIISERELEGDYFVDGLSDMTHCGKTH